MDPSTFRGSVHRSLRATEPAWPALGRVGSMASNEHTRPLQTSGNTSKEKKKHWDGMIFLHLMLHLISENLKCSDKVESILGGSVVESCAMNIINGHVYSVWSKRTSQKNLFGEYQSLAI